MSVKVLRNDLQKWLCSEWVKRKAGDSYDPDSNDLLLPIIGKCNEVKPQYNRVGFYYDTTDGICWYEFKLPSGRLVAFQYDITSFKYQWEVFNAAEKPIPNAEWEMIQHLIKKGYLKKTEGHSQEFYRRSFRRSHIESKKRMMAMMKRIKEKRNEVSNQGV